MPTYAFTTMKRLSPEQRGKLVESVTTIHQVEAKAPRYFVQVVFYTVEPGSMFIGGEVALDDHVWVRADIRAGRTREQKAAILHRIMRETGEILGTSPESVWVYVSDIPAERVAREADRGVLSDASGLFHLICQSWAELSICSKQGLVFHRRGQHAVQYRPELLLIDRLLQESQGLCCLGGRARRRIA
jgi:phenylpyruvate tautomerase PptA (4-oxalocrotonate tautomerase family)